MIAAGAARPTAGRVPVPEDAPTDEAVLKSPSWRAAGAGGRGDPPMRQYEPVVRGAVMRGIGSEPGIGRGEG
jgi:hypothetical protein